MLTDYAFSWRKSSGEAATFPSKKPFFCTISAIMSRKWYATDPIRCNIYILYSRNGSICIWKKSVKPWTRMSRSAGTSLFLPR